MYSRGKRIKRVSMCQKNDYKRFLVIIGAVCLTKEKSVIY